MNNALPIPTAPAKNFVQEQNTAFIAVQFGDGSEFDLERITTRIYEIGSRILRDTVEIGRYFIWVKAELDHGQFTEWLKSLGFSHERVAESMWLAHSHVDPDSDIARFLKQTNTAQSKTKALLFRQVSDEDIERAVQTDLFLDRPLDEIDRMSVRELKSVLRNTKKLHKHEVGRADREAERVLNLEAKLSRGSRDLSITEMPTAALGQAIIALSECKQDLMQWAEDPYTHEQGVNTSAYQGLLSTIEQTVQDIRTICSAID